MAETKTKAFRADEKTISRINAWMENNGIGNSEALERMADIIDMSEAKGALAGRSTEISNFESLVHQLTTAYTASLQLAQNAEARIRDEFAKRLTSQDDTIADLQARAKGLAEEASAAKDSEANALKDLEGLQRDYDSQAHALVAARAEAQKAQEAAQTARAQADRLTALTGDQAEEIRALKKSAAEADSLRKKVADLTSALDKAKEDSQRAAGRAEEKLANELEKAATRQEAAVLKAEKAGQDALIKTREACQGAISKAQGQAQAAIESAQAQAARYQKMYEELLTAAEKPTRKPRRKASEDEGTTEKK
jgi:chromosome segregation ATPase